MDRPHLWDDIGPSSQGKIITAIMKGDKEAAVKMMRGWSNGDLRSLKAAAETIAALATLELLER